MTDRSRRVCAECGARLKPGADACDLCGAAVSPDTPPPADPAPDTPPPRPSGEPAAAADDGVFCNRCGWRNPAGARFCSQCGAPLQDLAAARPAGRPVAATAGLPGPAPALPPSALPPGTSDDRPGAAPGVGRQVGIVVGAGVLLVVALFLVTALSKDARPTGPVVASNEAPVGTTTEAAALPPVAPEFAEQVMALEAEIESQEGDERLATQRELVNLLHGIGRRDRAALVQEAVARAEDTPEAWARAGNLFYDWAESIPDEGQRTAPARRAVAAYERVLERQPDNLDVRTDLAWISQYDPERPMEAVVQTNRVLEEDPDHVAANFNKGLLFLRINRLDQALAQFEKVKSLVDPASPVYGQAETAVQTIRERMGSGS